MSPKRSMPARALNKGHTAVAAQIDHAMCPQLLQSTARYRLKSRSSIRATRRRGALPVRVPPRIARNAARRRAARWPRSVDTVWDRSRIILLRTADFHIVFDESSHMGACDTRKAAGRDE
jgi:hypothetical protein